jgi:hypothetical protein
MALATLSDVEARLGRTLTTEENSKATAWLTDASALFRNKSEQRFELAESTVRLLPKDGVIRLLQRPVVSVTSVIDSNGADVQFTFDGHQTLYDIWTSLPVTVIYAHGSATIPDDVVAVVAGMVARTLSIAPEAASGITKQATGPFSEEYAAWAVGSQVMLSPAELLIADSYRRKHIGTMSIMGNGTFARYLPTGEHFGY